MKPLFHDTSIDISDTVKVAFANTAKLDGEPPAWPPEIVSEAYKQLPFLNTFEVDVALDKVDEERSYAVGKMLVYPSGMSKEAAFKAKQLISVPVIVRDGELSPLDIYHHNGGLFPMDGEKVATLLQTPQIFRGLGRVDDFSNTDLAGQIRPPVSDRYGQSAHRAGLEKSSSALVPHVLNADDLAKFASDMAEPRFRVVYDTVEDFRASVDTFLQGSEKTASEIADHRRASLKPSVIQFVENGVGYTVKTANHLAFHAEEVDRSMHWAKEQLSDDHFEQLLEEGSLTLTVNPIEIKFGMQKQASEVESFGAYEVLVGEVAHPVIVVPQTLSLDGDVMGDCTIIGKDLHGLQEKVAGAYLQTPHLTGGDFRGKGVLLYQVGVAAVASEPLEITSDVYEGTEKVAHLATRLGTGEVVQISLVEGLRSFVKLASGRYSVPAEVRYLPLRGDSVKVVSDIGQAQAVEELKKTASESYVDVCSDGHCFFLRGVNGRVFPDGMDKTAAAFALGALGVPTHNIEGVLSQASEKSIYRLPRTRPVVPEEAGLGAHIVKSASERRVVGGYVPHLRKDLLREVALLSLPPSGSMDKTAASVIIDKETVDNILSLRFVTPENARIYVDMVPELEKTASRLAELLVAARLGMDDVKEQSAKVAMLQVQSVIRGLKDLGSKIQ